MESPMPPSCRPVLARLALAVALCAAIGVAIARAASAPGTGPGPGGAPGGNGPGSGASGTGGNSGGGLRASPGPGLDETALAAISRQAEADIAACGDLPRRCVADALDAYAAALRRIAPQLAPRLRFLPDIVAQAAAGVRRAQTRGEAIGAVRKALVAVRKTIALLRADDPVTLKSNARAGLLVAETLQAAGVGLERAAGL
jgi:hypothetical protein